MILWFILQLLPHKIICLWLALLSGSTWHNTSYYGLSNCTPQHLLCQSTATGSWPVPLHMVIVCPVPARGYLNLPLTSPQGSPRPLTHTQDTTKWTPFSKWHFQLNFFKWKVFPQMISIIFWFQFHWCLFPKVVLTTSQPWFRQQCGVKQATSHYLIQWWPSSLLLL